MTVDNGNIVVLDNVNAGQNVNMTVNNGDEEINYILVGEKVTAGGDISAVINNGHVLVGEKVESTNGSIDLRSNKGGILIGFLGLDENGNALKTVEAKKNVNLTADNGVIEIYGETYAENGDITVYAASENYVEGEDGQNIIFGQYGKLTAKNGGADITVDNGDFHVTDKIEANQYLNAQVLNRGDIYLDRDVNVNGDATMSINGQGSVYGEDSKVISGGTTRVELTDGDLFLNLAEGKAVVLRMENNKEASRVETVRAEASGGANPDVELTGNFIQIGTIEAKGGNSVFEVSAMGAGNQKLINGNFSVEHLSSANGTHMPYLWANSGYVHVDEGNFVVDDVLAVDKIHLENDLTDLAIYGRIPTRDGEQLVYWNNLDMANSKTRFFQLYANGKVRTHRAVLIDAGRYYDKLYGDNLSVVDMMRERLTHEHGQYTFDSTWLTKPGEDLRKKMLFGMETMNDNIRQHNASNAELAVE